MKKLRTLVEDEEESKKILIPSADPVSMANVLFCANQIFTTRPPNFSSRRLFLVTDNDNPHAHDKALRSAAAVRAKDLYDLGVIIELFPISRPGHGFDRTLSYDDIVYRVLPSDPEAPAPIVSAAKASSTRAGISILESLLSSTKVAQPEVERRRRCSVNEKFFSAKVGVDHAAGMDICDSFGGLRTLLFAN